MKAMNELKLKLKQIKEQGLYRTLNEFSASQSKHTTINGKEMLLFSSNNYLEMSVHPAVKKAAIEVIEAYGVGSGGSRLTTGNYDVHRQLEERIASFHRTEKALVFNTGYMTNVGVISTIADENFIIYSDELNHASMIDGCRLSRGKTVVYKHNDIDDLAEKVQQYKGKKGLIVTDSVFSMDGDLANLPEIIRIAKEHRLLTMVDDAHGVGVIGKTGRGISEYFDCGQDIDIKVGTLSKALGSEGGYVCGKADLIDYLKNKARSFIFSTALSPAVIAASKAAFDVLENDHSLVLKLQDNISYLKAQLQTLDAPILAYDSAIMAVIIGGANEAVALSQALAEGGIYVPAIRPPTVPANESRLRITVMASHTKEDIDRLVSVLRKML